MTAATDWAPANGVETRLYRALGVGDEPAFLTELVTAELLVPVDDTGTGGWPVMVVDGMPCLPAFTSPAALAIGVGGAPLAYRRTGFRELVASWPDWRVPLLLDPLTPLHSRIMPADLVRLAAPPLADVLDAPGDHTRPAEGTMVQRYLSGNRAMLMLTGGESVVSGFVVAVHEVAHLAGPRAQLTGLRLPELDQEIDPDATVVCVVRWPAVGAQLYRVPGVDTDPPPPPLTVGGFVGGAVPAVRMFHTAGIRLPHGAALVRISDADPEELVAWYDADVRAWLLTEEWAARMPGGGG